MFRFWFAALVTLVGTVAGRIASVPNGDCYSLDGRAGRCIYLSQCESLSDIWETPVRSIRQSERLADSLCGRYSTNPLVCCLDDVVLQHQGFYNSIYSVKPSIRRTTRTTTTTPRTSPRPVTPSTCTGQDAAASSSNLNSAAIQQTTPQEFPWSALIQYRKPYGILGFHCGGALINDRYVLTAAHCIKAIPRTWEIFRVRLGEYYIKDPGLDCSTSQCTNGHLDADVEQIVIHEKYVTRLLSQFNDIALLRLAGNVGRTSFIQPVTLPFDGIDRMLVGKPLPVISAGWGRTTTAISTNVKMKVKLNLENLQVCAESYRPAGMKVRDTQLCASEWRGTGVCSCDSGGPLMVQLTGSGRYYLIGIVSFGPARCGVKSAPGVYTNVAKYMDWIAKNMY